MYSLVLATLLTSGAEAPSFHRLGGHAVTYSSCYGCCGGVVYYSPRCCPPPVVYSSCFGCCGGIVYSSGCFGCCGGMVYSSGCNGCYGGTVYGSTGYVTRSDYYEGEVVYGKGGQAPGYKGGQAPSGKGTQAPSAKGTQAPSGKGTQAPSAKGQSAPMKGQSAPSKSAQADASARLLVKAPVDVKIYVNGYLTRRQNESQVFNTPELVPGQTYHYEIVARREGEEAAVVIEKKVTVQAGRESVLDLSNEFSTTGVATASR